MGMKRAVWARVSVGLLILGVCVGCGEPPPLDMSLLTGEPCRPPCWQGLTPGVSTEEEVNALLLTSELVDQSTMFRGEITRGRGEVIGVSIQWWSTANMATVPRQFGNFADIVDGVLQAMTIGLDSKVTLQDLLEQYGYPDKFTAYMTPSYPRDVSVALYYASHGFIAELILAPEDVALRPETDILYIAYFRVAPVDEFLDLATYGAAAIEETAQDWQGYGPIQLIP